MTQSGREGYYELERLYAEGYFKPGTSPAVAVRDSPRMLGLYGYHPTNLQYYLQALEDMEAAADELLGIIESWLQ